ncbi:AEC family transporter [Endothiovibrio diazotrophicus]
MIDVLLQMAALIACGSLWRRFHPLGLDADTMRRALTGLVYVLLLPALVLSVLWQTPIGAESALIALAAAGGVLVALAAAWGIYRLTPLDAHRRGALILAAAFPNATYMGLPVLSTTFGDWGKGVAIQFDLFACTPLLLTVGILLARAHGNGGDGENPLRALAKVPPLWAAAAAPLLNLGGVPMPPLLVDLLKMMGGAVVPLMLIAVGMGLRWESLLPERLPVLLPVLLPTLTIRLLLIPLLVWQMAGFAGVEGQTLTAVVLEAAMPSMVLGIVLCDRYHLDTALYAMAVTISTALSLFTLPFWFGLAGG